MNETQRQDLLEAVNERLANTEDDALFDALDDARLALVKWDLQGAIPYEQQFRDWGLLDAAAPSPDDRPAPSGETDAALLPDGSQLEAIHAALRQRIRASAPGSETYIVAKSAREKLQAWDGQSPLPHAAELADWGIWPSGPAGDVFQSEDVPPPGQDPDDDLWSDFEAAQSLLAAQPYRAIQRLSALQARARGDLVKRVEAELNQARVDLENRTAARVAAARRVEQEKPRDYRAQADAWREVIALNPDSKKGQEALNALQQRVRQAIEADLIDIEERARQAAKDDQLPDLNTCRGEIEALCSRADLPEDLVARATELKDQVLSLLGETRDRLGIASTLAAETKWKPAYEKAKGYLEKIPPIEVIVDTAGVVKAAGEEVATGEFFKFVGGHYLAHTRGRVDEYLQRAQDNKRSAPETAQAALEEARGWLTDEVWIKDHRASLAPQLEEVEREIKAVERLLAQYEAARENVIAAQETGVPAREKLKLLEKARQTYSDYPDIEKYIEEARDVLAAEMAGEVAAQIADAREQVRREQFDAARETLQQARQDAIRAVPSPEPDSSLAQALKRIGQEEEAIGRAEKALRDFEGLIDDVKAAVDEYDESKALLRLQEARALLEEIPEKFVQHPAATEARSLVTARQGDAENYEAGRRAYERRNWAGACDYLDKVSTAYDRAEEARQLSKRARGALWAESALSLSEALTAQEDYRQMASSGWQDREALTAAEQRESAARAAAHSALENLPGSKVDQGITWARAYACCQEAMYVFDSDIGEDERTADLAAACRTEKQRLDQIREADQAFQHRIEEARDALKAVLDRNKRQLQLFERLVPLPESFRESVTRLEFALKRPSLIKEEMTGLLNTMRSAWRAAYLPVLQEVVAAGGKNVEPGQIEVVRQFAEELREASLLYDDEQSSGLGIEHLGDLYYQVRTIQLEKAYAILNESIVKDWAAITKNRRELLNLPGLDAERKQAIRQELHDAQSKWLEADLDTRRADEGAKAALTFLGDQLRSGDVPVTGALLKRWIKLCWEAEDWAEAERVARRFGTLMQDARTPATQRTLWQELTRIARNYATGDIEAAENYTAELEKQIDDPVIDQEIEWLEKRTLDRLLNTTWESHNRLDKDDNAEAKAYLPVARGYAKVKKLSPDHQVATQGLRSISEKLKPVVTQFCDQVEGLKIERGGLADACRAGDGLFDDLESIQAILPHLTLKQDTQDSFGEACEDLVAKKERWDRAQRHLQAAQEEIEAALAAPDAPRQEIGGGNWGVIVQGEFSGGGWDFSEARNRLTEVKNQAIQDKDEELKDLVKRKISELEGYEGTAEHLRQLVCDLLATISAEEFVQVREKAQTLQMAWQHASEQSICWDGLDDILSHMYLHPQPRTRSTLQEHRDFATKQQENLSAWEAHEQTVSRLYAELTGDDRYEGFLTKDLSDLKIILPLQDISDRCAAWADQCAEFLQVLEKTNAMPSPLSKRAVEVRQKVKYEDRKLYLNDKRAHVAGLKTEAEQLLDDLQEPLVRLRNHYNGLPRKVKNGRRAPCEEDVQLALGFYKQCRAIDPLNPEVQGLVKRLRNIGYSLR